MSTTLSSRPKHPFLSALAIAAPLMLVSIGIGLRADNASDPLDAAITPSRGAIEHPLGPLTIPAMRQRVYHASALSPVAGTQQTDIGYTTQVASYNSDGYRIDALVATPDTPAPPHGFPAVIVAHGFTNPSEYFSDGPEYRDIIGELASHGFLVIKPDYRGYGHSGGIATSGFYTPTDVYDLLNLATTLKHDALVNPADIGLWGHSMGAQIALRALVAKPGLIKAAALASGPTTTPEELYAQSYSADTSHEISPKPRNALVQQFGPPSNASPFWFQTAAINYLNDLKTNLLLLQAADDPVVRVDFTDELYRRLQSDHKIVSYQRYPVGGHGFAGPTHEQMLHDSLSFFDRNLTAPDAIGLHPAKP